MPTWVRFEKGREDKVGPTFGPFPFAQLTYGTLRVGPNGDELAGIVLDCEHDGDWVLAQDAPAPAIKSEHKDINWSDAVIYDGEQPES